MRSTANATAWRCRRRRQRRVANAAVLACLGSAEGRARVLQALTGGVDADVQIAEVFLGHRPIDDVGELRDVASGIARMPGSPAQVRALDTLGAAPAERSPDARRARAPFPRRPDGRRAARHCRGLHSLRLSAAPEARNGQHAESVPAEVDRRQRRHRHPDPPSAGPVAPCPECRRAIARRSGAIGAAPPRAAHLW